MEVVNVISNLGFPIACVVALGFYIYKVETSQTEQLKNLTDTVNNLKDTVNALTELVKTLYNKTEIKILRGGIENESTTEEGN